MVVPTGEGVEAVQSADRDGQPYRAWDYYFLLLGRGKREGGSTRRCST